MDISILLAQPSGAEFDDERHGRARPGMKQLKKDHQWLFGNAEPGLVHAVRGTAGNVDDAVEANTLLHGQED